MDGFRRADHILTLGRQDSQYKLKLLVANARIAVAHPEPLAPEYVPDRVELVCLFVEDHHWIDSGIPASDQLHIVERIKLVNNGNTLEIAYTMSDPKNWEGDWKVTKRWTRVDDTDIAEVSCLPDLNQHMPSTQSKDNVR